jgi:hypothetical protein
MHIEPQTARLVRYAWRGVSATVTRVTGDVHTLVRGAMRRLRSGDVFVTLVPGPRTIIDQVLRGVIEQWDQRARNEPVDETLEYQVVANRHVHGLVIAVGQHAAARVGAVADLLVVPCSRSLDDQVSRGLSPRRRWRGFAGLLDRVVPGRRHAP